MTGDQDFDGDGTAFRDRHARLRVAPARWVASSPLVPWPLRKAAARLCISMARKKYRRVRHIALDHSQWCSTGRPSGGLGPIWQYWAQGVDAAPPLVRACLRSVRRHCGSREVVMLDDRNVGDHVDLPAHIWAKRSLMGPQHFSNFIRMSLLHRHGGTWLDGTILLRRPIPAEVEREDFYMFRQTGEHPRIVETWFIHARKGHPLLETVLHGLSDYWKTYDRLHEYFMFPYHFEAALLLHRPLRRNFLHMPQRSADRPHELQWQLLRPFDEAAHGLILDGSWLHKLTHKYERPQVQDHLLCDAIIDGWADRRTLDPVVASQEMG